MANRRKHPTKSKVLVRRKAKCWLTKWTGKTCVCQEFRPKLFCRKRMQLIIVVYWHKLARFFSFLNNTKTIVSPQKSTGHSSQHNQNKQKPEWQQHLKVTFKGAKKLTGLQALRKRTQNGQPEFKLSHVQWIWQPGFLTLPPKVKCSKALNSCTKQMYR